MPASTTPPAQANAVRPRKVPIHLGSLPDGTPIIGMAEAARRRPDRRSIATRMASAIAQAVDRTGSATEADIKRAGFTAAQIQVHGDEARAQAARLRPDAAETGEVA
jgi:hypothetical protein